MLIPMITALGAVSAAAGGLQYAQRKRRAMIEEAVRVGQAVGALAASRAIDEAARAEGDTVRRAALAAEAARNVGFVAVRHQAVICNAIENGATPEQVAVAMDGPCCMAARRVRLRDRSQSVNVDTFRTLLAELGRARMVANAMPKGGERGDDFARRLDQLITVEAALVLAWLRFTADERAPMFERSITTPEQRTKGAREIHRLFASLEPRIREAAAADDADETNDQRRRRPRRRKPTADTLRTLAVRAEALRRAEQTTDAATLTRERAIWLVKYLHAHGDPVWRSMLAELSDPAALARRAPQIAERFRTLSRANA